jgi:hypothetical protein
VDEKWRVSRVVLAVDPGRSKCGVAVCSAGGVQARRIVPVDLLSDLIVDWIGRYHVTDIVVGDRTGSSAVLERLSPIRAIPIRRIPEGGTTLRARARYFAEHPPRGWRRLLPSGLQTPPEPYDDYAAVLLAEAALAGAPAAGQTLLSEAARKGEESGPPRRRTNREQ